MSDADTPTKKPESLIFVRIPHFLAGVLFFIAALINIANVIGRYVFSAPIFWAEEVLVFLVVWTVFLVMIEITYKGAHLNMDLLYAGMSPPIKMTVNTAVALTLIACSAFTAYESSQVVRLYLMNGNTSMAAEVPLYIPHAALLVGFSLMALAVIIRFKSYVTGKFDDTGAN